MESYKAFFKALYQNFNERKIEQVLSQVDEQVVWANGMDGGFEYGRDAVRSYWTRQFKMVSSRVEPLAIERENDIVNVQVHQVVHDTEGKLLADEVVEHRFHLSGNVIVKFEIGNKA